MTLEKWRTEKMEVQGDKVSLTSSDHDPDKQLIIEKFECTLARAGHNEQKYTDCGQMLK